MTVTGRFPLQQHAKETEEESSGGWRGAWGKNNNQGRVHLWRHQSHHWSWTRLKMGRNCHMPQFCKNNFILFEEQYVKFYAKL